VISGLTWCLPRLAGWRSGYVKVSGIGVPRRVKASRWALGQGGQVLQQAVEAAVGLSAGSCWQDALAWATAERRAGATGLPGRAGSGR
jgi:hypothetical protein